MKRAALWIWIAAIAVFIIDWGWMGLSLFNGNYDIAAEAYIGLGACAVILCAGLIYRYLGSRCPSCGKSLLPEWNCCPHCGETVRK